MYRSITIIVFLFYHCVLSGQYQNSFRYADSITYGCYMEKNWDELIVKGKEALDKGHDYYYMRMRMGIAYFEKQNYARASVHFKKALEFNNGDQVAREYLYYSAFLSGRHFQAWALLSGTTEENNNRIIRESRFKRHNLTLESFYSNFSTDELLSSPGDVFTNPEPGSQSITRYYLNTSLYASHILGERFAYFHSYTNLIKDSYLHFFDGTAAYEIPDQRLMQNQYYGSFNFFSPRGWTFTPAFHIILTGYQYPSSYGSGMNYRVSISNETNFGYVASFRMSRSGGYFGFSAEAGFSELNYIMQAQGGVSLTFYPLGNTNLYIGGNLSSIYRFEASSDQIPVISGLTAGFSVSGKVWFEFSGSDGYMNNYLENNGLFVYNGSDIVRRKVSGRLIVPFNKAAITFYAGAGRSWMSSEWIPDDGVNSVNSNIIEYFTNNLTGGITWNF